MKKLFTFTIVSILFFISLLITADEAIKVDDIIEKANEVAYYKGSDGKALVEMDIKDKNGKTRTRSFVVLRKNKADSKDQFFYVYFKEPADVRKMVFMVHKHLDKTDDRWLFLPAMDLVKRIAASDNRTSFVGSDYLYEDVSGRNPKDDKHELIETNDKYFVIKNTPKETEGVEFTYYNVWIDKTSFLPMKAEYYKGEKLYRTVEALETKTIQTFTTTTKSVVKNLETGSETTLSFSNIVYDNGFKDDLFTERYLRRAPKEARE